MEQQSVYSIDPSMYRSTAADNYEMQGYGDMEPNFGSMSMPAEASWFLISAGVSIVLGIVLFFTFLRKKNDGKFKGFAGWLYDFWNFKKLTIEAVLKLTYLILTLFITLGSFGLISTSIWLFLGVLLGGNFVVRLIYEFSLIMIIICKNTTDISSKMKKDEE